MPTRPIGPGTCNFPVNMPVGMAQQLRRLAFLRNQSAGAVMRRLIEGELDAARARGLQLVHDARQMVLPLAACLVIALGYIAVATSAVAGDNELRRPRVSVRRRDDVGIDIDGCAG